MATQMRPERRRTDRVGFFNRLRQFVWRLFVRVVGSENARALWAQWRESAVVPALFRTVRQPAATRHTSFSTGTGFMARFRARFMAFVASIRTFFTRRSASQTTVNVERSSDVVPPDARLQAVAEEVKPALTVAEILANFELDPEAEVVVLPHGPVDNDFYAFACQQGCSVVIFSDNRDCRFSCVDSEKTEPMFFIEREGELRKLKLTATAVQQKVRERDMLAAAKQEENGYFVNYDLEQDPRYIGPRPAQPAKPTCEEVELGAAVTQALPHSPPASTTVPAGVPTGADDAVVEQSADAVLAAAPDSLKAAAFGMILNLFRPCQGSDELSAQPQRVIYRDIEFNRINIPGDGNCLFTAIGRATGAESGETIRAIACAALQESKLVYLEHMQEPMVEHRRRVLFAKERLDYAEKQYLDSIVSLFQDANATGIELDRLNSDETRPSVFRVVGMRASVRSRNTCGQLYKGYTKAKDLFERSIPVGCEFNPDVFDDGLHVEIPGYREEEVKRRGKLEFKGAGTWTADYTMAREQYYDFYAQEMRKNGTFGTDLEVMALAQVYSRPIVIFSAAGVIIYGEEETGEPIFLEHDVSHYNLLETANARDMLAQLQARPALRHA